MKHKAVIATLLALAVAPVALVGCWSNAQNAAQGDKAEQSGSGTNDSTGATGTSADDTQGTSSVEFPLAEESIYTFDGDAASAQLVADMEAGNMPVECDVLYDQMGSLPNVAVTDPKIIARVYTLLGDVVVVGDDAMSVTDNYHHVIFTLQDGTKASFNFEGEGSLVRGGSNYAVSGDGPLWNYVRQLQGVTTGTNGAYAITIVEGEDLVENCPPTANAGDVVQIQTVFVTDADIVVNVTGTEVEWYDGMCYFEMPEHDVEVSVTVDTFGFDV